MKYFFSILLSFALCLTNINSTAFAEETQTSLLYIGSVNSEIGETVNVPICIQNNPGIISLVAEISYDSTALKLVNVKKDTSFWEAANMTPGGDLTAQPYRIIWYDGLAKTNFVEDGTLAELSFEVLKEGTHTISLSISESDTFNNNFERVAINVSDGVVEVPTEASITTSNITTTSVTTTSTISLTNPINTTNVTETLESTTTDQYEGNGKLVINGMTALVGETVNVPIRIQNNPGIISLVADISYDSTALKLVNVRKDTSFWDSANMTPGGDLTAQPYRIIWYDGLAKTNFVEDGTLAELSFEVLKEGSHKISLSISESDTFNINFKSVTCDVSSGIIDVSSVPTNAVNVASDDELCEWAINDFKEKTGIIAEKAEITSKEDYYDITLFDDNGNILDVYTVHPKTGIGFDQNGDQVDLPQTGYNSLRPIFIASGSVLLILFGLFAIIKSGAIRRRRDNY